MKPNIQERYDIIIRVIVYCFRNIFYSILRDLFTVFLKIDKF